MPKGWMPKGRMPKGRMSVGRTDRPPQCRHMALYYRFVGLTPGERSVVFAERDSAQRAAVVDAGRMAPSRAGGR